MARAARLKVFRTPIGFHDAYVAAPSQKAALEAWGTDSNLFARGEAEVVTDEKLTAEPLASPGKVIRKLRATEAEQFAALGEEKGAAKKHGKPEASKTRMPERPKPRPSRKALDAAERKLDEAEARQEREMEALKDREARLAREREKLRKKHKAERERLAETRDEARDKYEAAVRRWRDLD